MPYVEAEGRTLYAESFGNPDDPPLLLVNGLTSQLLMWPEDFCLAFVDRGFFVIRFDNRDVGLSTIFPSDARYTLSDMADDCVEVLGHFDIERAHVMGISMGGMIVQTLAIDHPEVVASMTSYASRTGNKDFGAATKEAMEALMAPEPTTRNEYIELAVTGHRIWGTADTVADEEFAEFMGACWDRGQPRGGGARQYAAIMASGNREEGLGLLDVPTLVIHGGADTLITPSGGQRTAEVIPGAQYVEIEDMGHDVPITEWPQIVQLVTMHAANSGGA